MAIKSYSGNLRDIGPHQSNKEGINFVYIDLGGNNLQNVNSSVVVGEFLQRGLGMEGDSTLWISHQLAKKTLLGVQLPNGKRVHLDVSAQTSLLFIYSLLPIVLIICGTQMGGGHNSNEASYFSYFFALLGALYPYVQWKKVQALKRIARGELFN
ncbi:hypothetical protein KW842_12495 [Duganella sp. sic0402]|uniref:hypothetical protein n=1 Tax=Duganella sp. sic0402 TaxID=2854786 RepID=UPI001C449797|nr:hypothetical protein [Duganella sp. sic0402]MBV7536587.1 hypothetical protein [Duganella sp. sic0402]